MNLFELVTLWKAVTHSYTSSAMKTAHAASLGPANVCSCRSLMHQGGQKLSSDRNPPPPSKTLNWSPGCIAQLLNQRHPH